VSKYLQHRPRLGEWDDLVEVMDRVRIPAGLKKGRCALASRCACQGARDQADNPPPLPVLHYGRYGFYIV
jgi:hypothetical protein